MAKKYITSCIGIEFTEDFLIFSQAKGDDEAVKIDKIQVVAIPPRTITNGDITDPDTLSDQITKTIDEGDYTSSNIVIGIKDTNFIKRCELFPKIGEDELRAQMEDKMGTSHLFQGKEFEIGLQYPKNEEDYPKFQPILYAVRTQSSIDTVKELMELVGLNLVAIDIMPLAVLRCAKYANALEEIPTLTIFLDSNIIDFNIVVDSNIVFSQVLRKDPDEILEDELTFEYLMLKLNHFLLSYTNEFPHKSPPEKFLLISRVDSTKKFLSAFQEAFPDITIELYNPVSNIKFESKKYEKNKDLLNQAMGSIGLSLRFFERYNESLSLIKVKKQMGPLINLIEAAIAAAILVTFIIIWFAVSFVLLNEVSKIEADIEETKNQITSLQTGEYLLRQQKLKNLKTTIDYYSSLKLNPYNKIGFFKTLSKNLPEDIVFNDLKYSKTREIVVRSTAFRQESIHKYYDDLSNDFEEVVIDSLKISPGEGNSSVNSFSLKFKWQDPDKNKNLGNKEASKP
jgi:hypothetical protein